MQINYRDNWFPNNCTDQNHPEKKKKKELWSGWQSITYIQIAKRLAHLQDNRSNKASVVQDNSSNKARDADTLRNLISNLKFGYGTVQVQDAKQIIFHKWTTELWDQKEY